MYIELETNILARLQLLLPDHSRLPYGIDIELNRLGKVAKGFAVIILGSKSSDSQVVGRLAFSTTIEVRMSDTFPPENKSDDVRLTVSNLLADRCIEVFKGLAAAKLDSQGVRNVTLLNISDPTFVDKEKTVYRTLTIEANIRA